MNKEMRKYLSTLHERPDHHKRNFALLASGSFTLLIFAIWATVNFGFDEQQVVGKNERRVEEVSPFASLIGGVGASFKALMGGVAELKTGLEVINSETDTYGR